MKRIECDVHHAKIIEPAVQFKRTQRHQWTTSGHAQAFRCRPAVGAHQSTRAELDAAVPTRDHHHHAVVTLTIDSRKNRPAGGAAGLAIVAGAVFLPNRYAQQLWVASGTDTRCTIASACAGDSMQQRWPESDCA